MVKKVVEYLKSSYEEIKKVLWPTKKETIRLTAYVLGVSLAVGLIVTGLDYVFKEVLSLII